MSMTTPLKPESLSWRGAISKYERPSLPRSLGQIANTIIPYITLWGMMYLSLRLSYWCTLLLAIPVAGFLVRTFIILHDCGHGSFFKSHQANRTLGFLTGLLTFIPSYYWSHEHAKHHACAGDLDNRGHGDVWTLTVQEYLAQSRWMRLWYRIYRHPAIMFGVGPLYLFLIRYRFCHWKGIPEARWSTVKTNGGLLGVLLVMHLTIGIKAYLMIQLPIILLAATAGVWLFYVQHQFEETYWERHDAWHFTRVALEGSSFYKLPRILQWYTGNIGFHHVHHLSPRIPNYHLQKCHKSNPMFKTMKTITLSSSLKSLTLHLWDEEKKRLIGFGDIKNVLSKRLMTRQHG